MQVADPAEVKKEIAVQLDNTPEERKKLQEQAGQNVEALMQVDVASPNKIGRASCRERV